MAIEVSKGPLTVDERGKSSDEGGKYFVITDISGAVICDTFNSEVTVIQEESDGDENGVWVNRWDQRGKADMQYLAHAGNCHFQMVEALKAAEIMVRIMLECWANTFTNDNGKFRNISGAGTLKEIQSALEKAQSDTASL